MEPENNSKDKYRKQPQFSDEILIDSDSENLTHDLNEALKSSIKSTSEIFAELVNIIEANITDQITKDNATKMVKNLNMEIIDTVSQLKQPTFEARPTHMRFEEE
ncbi:hypothetical protein N9W48_02875 [Candidatus Actinomarina sp.]|jgi:hypothetical protein|nr:hypothetical protein [Candidatus Actinomarina sp.]